MYIDPGFGSLLFQGVAAFLAACVAYFAFCKAKVLGVFRRKKKEEKDSSSASVSPADTDEDGFLK